MIAVVVSVSKARKRHRLRRLFGSLRGSSRTGAGAVERMLTARSAPMDIFDFVDATIRNPARWVIGAEAPDPVIS